LEDGLISFLVLQSR